MMQAWRKNKLQRCGWYMYTCVAVRSKLEFPSVYIAGIDVRGTPFCSGKYRELHSDGLSRKMRPPREAEGSLGWKVIVFGWSLSWPLNRNLRVLAWVGKTRDRAEIRVWCCSNHCHGVADKTEFGPRTGVKCGPSGWDMGQWNTGTCGLAQSTRILGSLKSLPVSRTLLSISNFLKV